MDLFTKFWNIRTMTAHLGSDKKKKRGTMGANIKKKFYLLKSNFIELSFVFENRNRSAKYS